MKRLVALFLTVLLAISFTACGIESNDVSSNGSSSFTNSYSSSSSSYKPNGSSSHGGSSSSSHFTNSSSGNAESSSSSMGGASSSSSGGGTVDNPCDVHVDSNDDGVCDDCFIDVEIMLDVIAVNDTHGRINDSATQEGVDELTTYIKNVRTQNPNTLVLSSGDMWQGSGEGILTQGAIVVDWMNEVGFSSMTLGNHEYDWGSSAIEKNGEIADFPFLGINIFDKTTNKRVSYCDASTIVDYGDYQVGIIGAIGDCLDDISGEHTKDMYFVVGDRLTELVKNEAQSLRSQGADLVIYSQHNGTTYDQVSNPPIKDYMISDYYDIEISNYVDIVFEGHSHNSYVFTDSKGVRHIQSGSESRACSRAQINVNFANGNTEVSQIENLDSRLYSYLADDPIVAELNVKYESVIGILDDVVGYSDKNYSSNELKNIAATLYLERAAEKWADYDIVLAGSNFSVRNPYNIYSGDVTYAQLLELFPFNNALHLCSIKGSDLLNRFINNSYHLCKYTPYGESVVNNINSSKTYYIVTDGFISWNASNNLTIEEVYAPDVFLRDLFADYIKDGNMGTKPTPPDSDYTLTSIADLNAIGNALKNVGVETAEIYYATGTITSINNTEFGNGYIEDENGNSIYVYGMWGEGNVKYQNLPQAERPVEGDTVVLKGTLMLYKKSDGTIVLEFYQTTIVNFTKA